MPAYRLGLNIFPTVPPAPLDENYASNLPPGTLASSIDPSLRTAYSSQWNVSIQHRLWSKGMAELSYVGSSSHSLPNTIDLSQCRPGADLYCATATKPWPRYDLLLWVTGSGNASYEALIGKFQHRSDKGLNLQIAYTMSKALTDTWQFTTLGYGQITSCRSCDKGPATFDVRHRAATSLVWALPFGRGQKFGSGLPPLLNRMASGWNLSGIVTMTTGQPLYMTAPMRTGNYYLNQLPNRVCDGRSSELSGNVRNNGFLWFEAACFVVPPSGYFGNSGRTVLSGPGFHNWDLAIEKAIPVGVEALRMLFRAEMFNAWNHTQFQAPNADAGAGANFGRISAARPPRLVQLGLKVAW